MFGWLNDKSLSLPGKIAWGSLIVMALIVPFAFSIALAGIAPFTADAFDTPKVFIIRILSLTMLIAWIADLLTNGGKIRFVKWLTVGMVLYAVWVTLSTVFALEPMQALFGKYRRYDGAWSSYIYLALLGVTMQYATSYERVKQMASAISWSSLLVSGYGLLQAFGADPMAWGELPFEANRSFSTFGNPDLLAGFLAFGVFVNAGLALSERSKNMRTWYWILFLLNSSVVITAFTRSIWVGAFVGAVVFVVFVLRQKAKFSSLDYTFMGATGAAVLTFIGVSLTRADAVMNFGSRLTSIFKFNEGSAITRFQIWGAAQDAIADRPLFGWGLDSFRMVFRIYQPAEYNTAAGYRSVADNVHNYPLQLAAGVGIVGAALLYILQLGIVASGMKYCWQLIESEENVAKGTQKRLQAEYNERLLYVGILAAVVAYMVHLFFGLALPGANFLVWICMAMLIAPTSRVVEIKGQPMAMPVVVVCMLLSLAPLYYSCTHLWADHLHEVSAREKVIGDPALAVELAKKASNLNPDNDQYQAQYARFAVELSLNDPSAMDFVEVIKLCEDSLNKFSNEYDMYTLLLSVYEVAGQAVDPSYFEKGIKLAEKQIKVMPNGLALRFNYAKMLKFVGRTSDAIEQLDYCIKWDPAFADAQELKAELATSVAN